MCGSGQLLFIFGFLSLFYFNLAVKCRDYEAGGFPDKHQCNGKVCIKFKKDGYFYGECCSNDPDNCGGKDNGCYNWTTFDFNDPICSFSIAYQPGNWHVCCCNKKDYCEDTGPTPPPPNTTTPRPTSKVTTEPGPTPTTKPANHTTIKPGPSPSRRTTKSTKTSPQTTKPEGNASKMTILPLWLSVLTALLMTE